MAGQVPWGVGDVAGWRGAPPCSLLLPYQRRAWMASSNDLGSAVCVDCGDAFGIRTVLVRVYERRRMTDFRYRWCSKCAQGFKWLLRDRCNSWASQGLVWDGDAPMVVRSGIK